MKHPNTLDRASTALVVVDMQEKFAPAIPEFDRTVQNVVKLILAFQMYKLPILVTEQYPKGLGATVDVIRRQFKVFEAAEKLDFACTGCAQFLSQLESLNVQNVVVCGVETHVCVNQTALSLLQHGYRVHVVADATASRSALDHDIALRKMIQADVVPATTEMCLFELCEKAGTESFNIIQRMVKATVPAKSSEAAPESTAPAPQKPKAPTAKPPTQPEETRALKRPSVLPVKQERPAETAPAKKPVAPALVDAEVDIEELLPPAPPAAAPKTATVAKPSTEVRPQAQEKPRESLDVTGLKTVAPRVSKPVKEEPKAPPPADEEVDLEELLPPDPPAAAPKTATVAKPSTEVRPQASEKPRESLDVTGLKTVAPRVSKPVKEEPKAPPPADEEVDLEELLPPDPPAAAPRAATVAKPSTEVRPQAQEKPQESLDVTGLKTVALRVSKPAKEEPKTPPPADKEVDLEELLDKTPLAQPQTEEEKADIAELEELLAETSEINPPKPAGAHQTSASTSGDDMFDIDDLLGEKKG